MSSSDDGSHLDWVSPNLTNCNNPTKEVCVSNKNKKCFLLNDEINNSQCNELILEYLDYMGMSSTLVAFKHELSLTDQAVSCYSGKLDTIFSLIMKCDIFDALEIVETLYNDFTTKQNNLYIKILSLKYFEYIFDSKITEAVEFSQKYFIKYIEGESRSEFVNDILMLLAFEDPNCSPNRHFLCLPFRSTVAHEVCVIVANHLQISPNTPDLTTLFRAIYFTENELDCFKDSLTFIDD